MQQLLLDRNNMEKEEIKLITLFISAWAWHLTSVIILSSMLIALWLGKYPFVLGLAGVILLTEYLAWSRKKELENGLD